MTYPTFDEMREFIASRHSPRVLEAGTINGRKISEEYNELVDAIEGLNECAAPDVPEHHATHLIEVGEEGADLILTVIRECAVLGIDVADYVRRKHEINMASEWYDLSDGRFKRVK